MAKDYYGNSESLFEGHLFLFTIRNAVKPNWNCRIRIPGRTGYYRKSLNTTSRSEAIKEGTDLYLKVRAKADFGLPTEIVTAKRVWEEFLKHRSAQGYTNIKFKQFWERYFGPYFGQFKDMNDIDQAAVDEYFAEDGFRRTYWKRNPPKLVRNPNNRNRQYWEANNYTDDPAFRTMHWECSVVRGFLRFAKDRGYIGHLPIVYNPMSAKETTESTRGVFSIRQYRALTAYLRGQCMREPRNKQGRLNPVMKVNAERMRMWVLLLAATGIRPQEAKALRWHMIQKFDAHSNADFYTMIEMPAAICKAKRKGRREGRTVFSFDGPVTYTRLMERWRSFCPTWEEDQLVFPSNKNHDRHFNYSVEFRRTLTNMGMRFDEDDLPLTSYSLRHFYITQRIKNQVPLAAIAKNCGHTVETLERTYNRILASDMVEYLSMIDGVGLREQVEQQEDDEDL